MREAESTRTGTVALGAHAGHAGRIVIHVHVAGLVRLIQLDVRRILFSSRFAGQRIEDI